MPVIFLLLLSFFSLGMAPAPKPIPDTTLPKVQITTPANNATVSAALNISATCTDNIGVKKVGFYVDAGLKKTLTCGPYTFSWNTTSASNGSHTLKVIAYDAANNSAQAQIKVTVNNAPPDAAPPAGTVKINNNTQYTNTTFVTLNLSAQDNSGGSGMGAGARMQFSNDNKTWPSPETYTITKAWTLASGDGTKTVYVKFKDAAGNWSQAYSDAIILDTTKPAITITMPQNGAVITSP